MIPCVDSPEAITSGTPVARIDMSQMDPEDMKIMLEHSRDGFYSNKELAPIREYSTNARDAHVRKGIPTEPILVTLPTEFEPTFKVRDFGKGLTLDEIQNVYFKYWKSTKRNSNDENGCLGIGSKSAFAYTAVYTVTTWCEGMKTVITGSKNGFADVIYRDENILNEPDGVEISIPVLQKDIEKFILEAMNLYKYWDIRPKFINISEDTLKQHFTTMDTDPFLKGEGWEVRPAGYGSGESVAVMSNVAYKIDWYQVKNGIDRGIYAKINGIFDFLAGNLTTMRFPNGTLSFTPNRESLQYNEPTMNALSNKLVEIYDTLLSIITTKISAAKNLWEAKIIYNTIFRKDLDGFDKESSFGGNLHAVETLVRNRVMWNGISITNGYFDDLEEWDKNVGNSNFDSESNPLFGIYVKNPKTKGVKKGRPSHRANNKMVASPKSVVIIQDTEQGRLLTAAAMMYLYDTNSNISQVYSLTFTNPQVKDAFYKHYNFDSVPVVYISQMEAQLKAYIKAMKAGGTATSISRPLNCPYFKVQNLRRNGSAYLNSFSWDTEDVNARGVSGGVFLPYKKTYGNGGGIVIRGNLISRNDASTHVQSLYDLVQLTGTPLNKVYGIHQRSSEASWFEKAVENGIWVNAEKFVETELKKLDEEMIKTVVGFSRLRKYGRIGTSMAKKLLPLLKNTDSTLYTYCKLVSENVAKDLHLAEIVILWGISGYDTEVSKFEKMIDEIQEMYPMLFNVDFDSEVRSDDMDDTIDKAHLKLVADYVNMVDSCLTKV
jgi:hypothetical protein